ncbi:MAG: hypothetical protein ACRYHA_27970 [Janthinobacterium lividum]
MRSDDHDQVGGTGDVIDLLERIPETRSIPRLRDRTLVMPIDFHRGDKRVGQSIAKPFLSDFANFHTSSQICDVIAPHRTVKRKNRGNLGVLDASAFRHSVAKFGATATCTIDSPVPHKPSHAMVAPHAGTSNSHYACPLARLSRWYGSGRTTNDL